MSKYYESLLSRHALEESVQPQIEHEFEEAAEGEEIERKKKLKTRWGHLEAVAGADKRLAMAARHIVERFEKRCDALDGKASLGCRSLRICVEPHAKIVKLRLQWASDDDYWGAIKVVDTLGT